MFALLVLAAGADPAIVVENRTTQAFVVVANRTTRPPARKEQPAATPALVPIGYELILDGPRAGMILPVSPAAGLIPAVSSGCHIDPRTGQQVCPTPPQRRR